MKITKLHLKKFKVFDDLKLDFTGKDGQPLNQIVLAGLNGTGKTTVLEALRGVFSVAFDYITFANDRNKRIEKYKYREKVFVEAKHFDNYVKFPNDANSKSLGSFLYNQNIKIVYRPAKIRNEIIRKETHNSYPKDEKFLNNLNVLEISYEVANTYSGRSFYDNDLGVIPGTNPEYLHYNKGSLKEIILTPITKKVFKNKEIPPKQLIESEIADMNSIFNGIELNSRFVDIDDDNLFFESANGQRITFEELSSGEKQLYFMGFMLKNLNINNTIIMIDEPEDSLHPKWQSQLLQFYSNIGENNQVILATHSPHIIGSAKAESVFLLKNENGKITASHPKYSKGHSIPYVLSEIMDVDYRNTYANNLVDDYLTLIRKGEHKKEQGKKLLEKIEALNLAPNSEEQQRIDLSLRRFESIGR